MHPYGVIRYRPVTVRYVTGDEVNITASNVVVSIYVYGLTEYV